LESTFSAVHPYFLEPKYSAFLVLTQTCDLVRRNGRPCKSDYINLAAVRPLGQVLPAFLSKVCRVVLDGVYIKNERSRAENMLQRIVNQNEQTLGLFYLHPDVAVRIAEPSVAMLQVSIALRAREHYDTLREARVGRLNPLFQSQLGWLVGNLYARIATPDWDATELSELVEELISVRDGEGRVARWIGEKELRQIERKAKRTLRDATREEFDKAVAEHAPPSPKQAALARVRAILGSVLQDLPTDQEKQVVNRLRNDPGFSALFR
jgi:hypothetical protein